MSLNLEGLSKYEFLESIVSLKCFIFDYLKWIVSEYSELGFLNKRCYHRQIDLVNRNWPF